MEDILTRYFQINSNDLVYLKFILEAYEGLTTMSTEDGRCGIVRISMPSSFCQEVDDLLEGLHAEIQFAEVVQAPQGTDADNRWIKKGDLCHA